MKILITGVYGIVGSYLNKVLKEEHEVIGIGRKAEYLECEKYYSCDITNVNELERIFIENKDIDIVIHCAALAHNKGNDLSFDRFMNVNYHATEYLVNLSNKYLNLKKFIFVSTISVYGEQIDKREYKESDISNPKSPYAIAKSKSEKYIKDELKASYTILRLAPVYSDKFLLNIERRTKLKGFNYKVGKGENKLSMCNIKNIGVAIHYIVNNYETEANEIYNISDVKEYSFNDLLKVNNSKSAVRIPKVFIKTIYSINESLLKKQFLHENSIKLLTDNIYPSKKINEKVPLKYDITDLYIK